MTASAMPISPRVRTARPQHKAQVRARIFAAAIPLFLDRGFDGVTMDDIAAASGVSRRSVFRYFPTKADVVLAWTLAANEDLAPSVAAQPRDLPAIVRLCDGILAHVRSHWAGHDRMLKMGILSASTPELRARAHEKFDLWAEALALQLARDSGREDPAPAEQLAVALVMAAYRVVTRRWVETRGARPIAPMLEEAFAHLRPIRFLAETP